MSSNNFSRRRRGMRFKPKGGLNPAQQKTDREAVEARADVVSEQGGSDRLFEKRHQNEIERAENVAAGLPPEGKPEAAAPADHAHPHEHKPEAAPVAPVAEETFAPVKIPEQPKGLLETITTAAANIVKKVQRLIRPEKKVHKEVIINAETLETRVAVTEDGKLEEFNIERTTEERLVGSIFKGRVRNLEDGLKAAFVDIGFEKNAFLHYWDIVPNQFDSGVEIVERENQGRRPQRPKITQKDIPRLYSPGSDIIVQVTKGPISTKGPRVTTNLVLPGRFLVLLPNSDQSGISRKIENPEERKRLKKILRQLSIPDGMGVIMRTAGEGQQLRYFVRDLAFLLEEWNEVQEKIKKQPMATCVFQEPDLIERTVRDFLTEDVERIVVDTQKAHDRMREMIMKIS
ncbi:MAG TPA: ribonuclease E/G, partial [Verrucomicrobiae bacterium]